VSAFSIEYLTTLLVLLFVIGLMLLMAYGVRRTGLAGPVVQQQGNRRLSVIEVLPVDARRRLVLVRRDDTEHLLLLGPEGERVVESGIDASGRPPPNPNRLSFADTLGRLTKRRPGAGGNGEPDDTPPERAASNDKKAPESETRP